MQIIGVDLSYYWHERLLRRKDLMRRGLPAPRLFSAVHFRRGEWVSSNGVCATRRRTVPGRVAITMRDPFTINR